MNQNKTVTTERSDVMARGMRWNPDSVADYMEQYVRKMRPVEPAASDVADDGPESRLAGRISKWAKNSGYPILNLRQSAKTKTLIPLGWPDVCLVLPGRVVFIELKSAGGRLRKEQHEVARQFAYLKNAIHVVRSFKRFMEIVNDVPRTA
jgi:hypothetical protein